MKKILWGALIMVAAGTAVADNYTRGYMRKDGTYVQPHYQTAPNQYRYDNYSSQGNTNPYTGQQGSQRNEFSNPPAYNQNYGNPNYNNSNPYNRRPRY